MNSISDSSGASLSEKQLQRYHSKQQEHKQCAHRTSSLVSATQPINQVMVIVCLSESVTTLPEDQEVRHREPNTAVFINSTRIGKGSLLIADSRLVVKDVFVYKLHFPITLLLSHDDVYPCLRMLCPRFAFNSSLFEEHLIHKACDSSFV